MLRKSSSVEFDLVCLKLADEAFNVNAVLVILPLQKPKISKKRQRPPKVVRLGRELETGRCKDLCYTYRIVKP